MAKKLYTINTINNFMDVIYNPHLKPYLEENGIQAVNIMDDSLLSSTLEDGGMTPKTATRMLNYAKTAEQDGAGALLVTCTSVNGATKMIKPLMGIPMINIEEPVAEMAVAAGTKIGILGTIPSSPIAMERVIREKAAEAGKEIEIVATYAKGAFEELQAGNRDKHDEMVNECLYKLAEEVDCIAFSQISMSLLKHEEVKVPLFKIGRSGVERICQMMAEAE